MEKYGLIGYPLRHSFSIGYFNEKFKSEGINAEYVNFEIPKINDFMEVIEENPNLRGLNVTIPYKEQVIPFLSELDPDTAKIGAVNVIKIIRQPKGKVKLVGYNSDIIGFTQSIQPLLQPHHKKALILGTGGASKAEGPGAAGASAAFRFAGGAVLCRPGGIAPGRGLAAGQGGAGPEPGPLRRRPHSGGLPGAGPADYDHSGRGVSPASAEYL